MAIHHDKHAYGNLEKLQEDMAEEELLKMLSSLKKKEASGEKDVEKAEEEKKITRFDVFVKKEQNLTFL